MMMMMVVAALARIMMDMMNHMRKVLGMSNRSLMLSQKLCYTMVCNLPKKRWNVHKMCTHGVPSLSCVFNMYMLSTVSKI